MQIFQFVYYLGLVLTWQEMTCARRLLVEQNDMAGDV